MKYTSKQIIERALNLADISNTDFLTHTEQLQYINDAWQTVYQWLINKGDKQFVKEAALEAGESGEFTEYKLPDDLYQIKSLKNRITGQTILRQTESEGINSGKYEIVNDRIRLYGVASAPLLLTYWTTPTFITFPDKKIDFTPSAAVIDSCLDSVLLANGSVVNAVTGEFIAAIESEAILGNGYYITTVDGTYSVKSFDGTELNSITPEGDIEFFRNSNGSIYYQTLESSNYTAPKSAVTSKVVLNKEGPRFIANIDDYWIYYSQPNSELRVYNSDRDDEFSIPLDYTPEKIQIASYFNNQPAFYLISDNRVWLYTFDDNYNIEYDKLKLKPDFIYAALKYGILTLDGLYSVMPDTELNFPNELYFSLIACDLAMRYAMKMNANTDGLSNLYTNMQTTFMNTLSQDNGYTRIRNVY